MFMNASGSGLDNVLRNEQISFRPAGTLAVEGRQLRTVDKLLNGRRNPSPEVKKKRHFRGRGFHKIRLNGVTRTTVNE